MTPIKLVFKHLNLYSLACGIQIKSVMASLANHLLMSVCVRVYLLLFIQNQFLQKYKSLFQELFEASTESTVGKLGKVFRGKKK